MTFSTARVLAAWLTAAPARGGLRLPGCLAPALVLLVLACGGNHVASEREIQVEAVPRKAVITAGKELPLGFTVAGTANRAIHWKVAEPNGGTITPGGVYTAPAQPGIYHVEVRSAVRPAAMDRVEITVHPAPEAVSLTAHPGTIRPGGTVTVTPVFRGGQGFLEPGNLSLTSGTPLDFTPIRDTTYILRVRNALGVVAETSAQVQVEHLQRVLHDIHAPAVVRVGSHHVAWVERRVGARLAWSSDDVIFLGNEPNPTTPVVVFTPREGRETFTLKVRAEGGTDLAGQGQAGPANYEFRGAVERPGADAPVIRLDRPFLTAGKAGYLARVGNPVPGAQYTWSIQNGSFPAPDPAGTEVRFDAGRADYLLLTCTAAAGATGAASSSTIGVALLEPPSPPVLNAPGQSVAGIRHWAYVRSPKAHETYRWELDPAQGSLDQDQAAVVAPMASFKALRPGPFTLRCRAENEAGEVSEPTTLTLTALGPFVLQEPQIVWPQFIHENSGPHTLSVVNRPEGVTYTWEVAGGTPASSTGHELTFQAGAGPSLIITCTARETATGATSHASKGYELVRAPARPVPQAPSHVAAGTTQVAGLAQAGRPGERFEWSMTNGDLRPLRAEDRGVVALFEPRAAGPYTLTVVAVNAAGERSLPGTFTGTVTASGSAPTAGSTGLAVSYHSSVFTLGAGVIPDQRPTVTNAVGPVTYALNGALPAGLDFEPATGRISGQPSAAGPAQFRVAATAANGTALSDTIVYLVNGSGATSPDTALTVSYDSARATAGARMTDLRPQVRNAGGVASFAVAWGSLPPDVSLDPGNGTLSGTPSTPGTYLFQIEARDGHRTARSRVMGIVVDGPAGGGSTSGGASGGGLEVSYDAAHFMPGTPIPGQFPRVRNAAGSLQFTVASGQLPHNLHLNPATGEISGTPSGASNGLFQVAVSDGTSTAVSGNIAYLMRGGGSGSGSTTFALGYDPNTFTVGHAIPHQRPWVSNPPGTLNFRLWQGQLPQDLQLDPATGVISGTPSHPGPSSFVILATQVGGTASAMAAPVTYMVNPTAALSLAYTDNPPDLKTRVPIPTQAPSLQNPTPGSPASYSWTGNPPPGLILDPDKGEITGLPTQPGMFGFTVTARSWNRSASANLTYNIAVGPQLTLHYDDIDVDTRGAAVDLNPRFRNNLYTEFEYTLEPGSVLPTPLVLNRTTGKITGQATQTGSFPFRVRVRNFDVANPTAPGDTAVSNLVACTIAPYTALALTDFSTDPVVRVLDPGQVANFRWAYVGIPKSLRLSRNLLPNLAAAPADSPILSTTVGTPGAFNGVEVTRRQTFTLALEDRFAGPTRTGSFTLATRGMEAVAGNPRTAFPSLEYQDGTETEARLPDITGLALVNGSLLAAEGRFHTIRRFNPGIGHWERFKGIPMGPDQGAPHVANQRLNQPGAMVVRTEGTVAYLYVADTGSHTIKRMRLDGSGDIEVFAGVRGEAGGTDGPRTAALAALAPGGPAPARFGRIMDLKIHENVLYIADLDHGIRRLDFGTDEVTTLRAGLGGYRTDPAVLSSDTPPGPWPELRGPIALAVTNADWLDAAGHPRAGAGGHLQGPCIFVVTENQPEFPIRPRAPGAPPAPIKENYTIQVLKPHDGPDAHGNLTHWLLTRYAGQKPGNDDGLLSVRQSSTQSTLGALFKHPVALFAVGNDLLVVDDRTNAIRRIDRVAARVSTLAGFKTTDASDPSTFGLVDEPLDGRKAKFKSPSRLVQGADANEFLLIDQGGTAIRRIRRNLAGAPATAVEVRTLISQKRPMGTALPAPPPLPPPPADRPGLLERIIMPPTARGQSGDINPGFELPFSNPLGVVVERASGDAFVVGGNQTVRRVMLLGSGEVRATTVKTFAGVEGGVGLATVAQPVAGERATKFSHPYEIGMDGLDRQYILEHNGSRVRMIDRGVVHLFLRGLPAPAPVPVPAAGAPPAPPAPPATGVAPFDPLPWRRPDPDAPVPHLAVRPGGNSPQLLALSRRPRIPATPTSAELDLPWRIGVCRVAPGQVAADFDTQFEPVDVQFDHPASTGPAAKAMAFGQDSRLYVLFEDRQRQVCEIHTYVRPAGPFPQTWQRQGAPTEFGPGLPGICQNWGFPVIHAMAVDSRDNLYCTDSANAMVWLRRADTGEMVKLAGDPPVHRLRGTLPHQPFDQPLYHPTGIAVTADDDLVILDGNCVVQLTAPGVTGYPWQPAIPVAWVPQAEHGYGYVAPPPAPAAGAGAAGAGAGAGGGGAGPGAGAPPPRRDQNLERFNAARDAFNRTTPTGRDYAAALPLLRKYRQFAPPTHANRPEAKRMLLETLYELWVRARAAGAAPARITELAEEYEAVLASPGLPSTDAHSTEVHDWLNPPTP